MNNLGRGDHVTLTIQKDGSMVVHPGMKEDEKDREIHLFIEADESEDSIMRRIIGSFLDGYTTIKLTSARIFNVGQQKAIRRIVSMLYMMIMESDAGSIVLQTLIDESKTSLISGIERMHIITYSMCRDILHSMINMDEELAKAVVSLEDDVDQLMYFLLRLIRSAALSPSLANQLGLDALDCLDFQTIVHRIERIADHTTNIAESVIALIESQQDIPGEVLSILIDAAEKSFTSYSMAVQSFLSKDIATTDEIIDMEKEIDELAPTHALPYLTEADDISTIRNTISIIESIKKISHYAADIAELTIDRTYKSQNF